jgi:RHS repeat-associated protein
MWNPCNAIGWILRLLRRPQDASAVSAPQPKRGNTFRRVQPYIAAVCLWFGTLSLVQAQNSCTLYRANIDGNFSGPWTLTVAEAGNEAVAQCNESPQSWRTCYAATVGFCNALPGYTCTGEVPSNMQAPTGGNENFYSMTVLVTSSSGGSSGNATFGLQANTVQNCLQYVVEAPVSTPAAADEGSNCPACKNGPTDPVNPSSGNEWLEETDIEPVGAYGRLGFKRYYNSLDSSSGDMGPGWRHSFSRNLGIQFVSTGSTLVSSPYSTQAAACTSGWAQIQSGVAGFQAASASYSNGICTVSSGSASMVLPIGLVPSGGSLIIVQAFRDDGHIVNFTTNGSGFTVEPGVGYQLATTQSGGYQLIDEQDNVEIYDSTGRLLSITDRAGNTQTLTYNASSGLLSSLTDTFGHTLTFSYNGQSRLQSVSAPNGSSVQYTYGNSGYLSQVENLDGTTRQYNYNDSNWAIGISTVQDESSQTEFSLSYNSQGQVVSSTLGGVSSSMSFTYNNDGSTTETDPLGAVRTFQSQEVGDHELSSAVTGAPCFQCGYVAATGYDNGGFLASEADFNGNTTTYVYDDTRGLETSRTEASGTSSSRTITTQWSSSYRLPTLISDYAGETASGSPIRATAFNYDGSGNLLSKAVTDPATGLTRTWSYTYDGNGRVLTATDPRQNVTTYTYYTCTTGYQCGELETATDALSHVTTYNTYNADGRPLTITDPNGVVTTLAYDARDRVTSRSVGGETTSFAYYPTGLLNKVTLSDGSSLSYAYDAAHRLTQVNDGLGNKLVYTLDAMGNRTAEKSYDTSGTLHRTHTRVINTLNEIYQEVNAAGTSAVTTTFGYDNDGNATSIDAPLSRNTGQSYDALSRVSSITDPGSGVTTFGYDAEDDLTSVQDPRNLVTSYVYDGFGGLTSQASPDTGTTANTYDSVGNLATSTDARGATATYAYDALNRVTSLAYSLSGTTDQTLVFTYDQGANGIGHLTGASDANHSMSFGYDSLGEMTAMSQKVGTVTGSVSYGYTNRDLTSITTPSGQAITYGYNSNHQVTSIAVNGTTVLSNASYEPFGPVDGWTWGNGSASTRAFNGDGLITGIDNPGNQQSLTYDNASRTASKTNTASNSTSWTYGYDSLDRLTSGNEISLKKGWTYDADGNRLTETGSTPSTYSISSTSNQITGITGTLARTYAYDAAGNMLGDTTNTATYNDAGRLKTLTTGTTTTTFIYNALGEMISAKGSTTTLYVYDQAGHLLGEYSGTGTLIQETVWLGDIPVATLRPSGTSVAIYYVETDPLDIPTAVIVPSNNAVRWDWYTNPFGNAGPAIDPQNLGNFTYDLRYPGQIAGAWGSTYQNDNRDYDPNVGAYDESDPIGLSGGSYSTYAYALNNPISNDDPDGQQVAAGAGIGTLVEPGLGTVIGAAIGVGIEAAVVHEVCKDHKCPPCKTVSGKIVDLGQIAYRPLDTPPPGKPQHGIEGPHYNIYMAHQNPNNCQCFWQPIGAVAPADLPPGAIPIEPFAN